MVKNLNHDVHVHQGRFGLSILNSMIGGYLEKENNPLAVQFGFYHKSRRLDLDLPIAPQLDTSISNKVVVFVHGLSNLENVWDYPPDEGTSASILSHYIDVCLDTENSRIEQNYGTKLNAEHGFTPLFLRYNTGLSLEKNALLFNKLLCKLSEVYPQKIEEIVLVGHGLGGRLLNHTQHTAKINEAKWLSSLSRCLYLGKRNEGSFFTLVLRLGSLMVRQLPIFYNHSVANWLDHRSTQLQETHVSKSRIESKTHEDAGKAMFLDEVRHLFIDGDLKTDSKDDSATNKNIVPSNAPSHSTNAYLEGISPVKLTHSDRVYSILSSWVTSVDEENGIKQQTYALPTKHPIQKVECKEEASNDANSILLAGTVGLVASAYDKTLETIETVHYSIAEEPFYALDKVPVVSQIAKPVEAAHRTMLDNLYRDLRNQGKRMHRFAAKIA